MSDYASFPTFSVMKKELHFSSRQNPFSSSWEEHSLNANSDTALEIHICCLCPKFSFREELPWFDS